MGCLHLQSLAANQGYGAWRKLGMLLALLALACGENGLLPGTVDPGQDFEIAEIVFDEGFFYCRVEPLLFRQRCGPGDPARGDASGGCHYNVTSYHLTDYAPLVAESCNGVVPGGSGIPAQARQNYQTSQGRMKRNPEVAPLLIRPTGAALHPREIFQSSSAEADLIREWATRFSTQ